jgi:hypothetical protein
VKNAAKDKAIYTHGIISVPVYIFLGYVAVHHWGWLDGMAALLGFMTLIGATRTKTSWDDLYPPGEESKP